MKSRGFSLLLALGFCTLAVSVALGEGTAAGEHLKNLPQGWALVQSSSIPAQQLAAIGAKLGGRVVRLDNVILSVNGGRLQVNTVECATENDAAKVHEALLKAHQGLQVACPREGRLVYEFVTKDSSLIERAYRELHFPPPKAVYEVTFQATPIVKCDYMSWNKMFNAFLAPTPSESQIGELAKSFTFGDQICVRKSGLGKEATAFSWSTSPAQSRASAAGEITTYSFKGIPKKFGIPQVGATAKVSCESFTLTPSTRKAEAALLGATDFWPSTDPEMIALARQIVGDKTTTRDKVAALLAWHLPAKNLRYAGATGSRYGVKLVHSQRFGHCWDFSDSFVTLCRASKIPCRQVLGWLHGQSGHVWAEVLIEGEGWMQVDPTAGMGCDCRYIPLMATEDGQISLVYTSAVRIREIAAGEKPAQ